MDQSKSNSSENKKSSNEIPLPRRGIGLEFFVGVFTIAGVLAAGYLCIGLGGLQIGQSDTYEIFAEFDNISGLKDGASVEIAGVQIGEVAGLELNDPVARITLRIDNSVKIKDDDIAAIRTKGIIGDRYVKISRGSSDDYLDPSSTIVDTESVVDIEDIIGKIVHSLDGGDSDEPEGSEESSGEVENE